MQLNTSKVFKHLLQLQFKATICKVGINPCVEVPKRITDKLTPVKGYIPIVGKIEGFPFRQNLCPVKGAPYRLYVNGPMLKGSGTSLGDTVKISIEQDPEPRTRYSPMTPEFRKRLDNEGVMRVFNALLPSRQKEIILYLSRLKTEEARERNVIKVLADLKKAK